MILKRVVASVQAFTINHVGCADRTELLDPHSRKTMRVVSLIYIFVSMNGKMEKKKIYATGFEVF